jgi:hypothetical protein
MGFHARSTKLLASYQTLAKYRLPMTASILLSVVCTLPYQPMHYNTADEGNELTTAATANAMNATTPIS